MRKLSPEKIENARSLVGDVTQEQLRHVESYIGEKLGVFIPSVGPCEYALKPGHTHPAWSFILYFEPDSQHVRRSIDIPDSHFFAVAMGPGIPHEEEPADDFRRYAAVMIEPSFFETIFRSYDLGNAVLPFCEWRQFAVHKDVFLYLKKFMNECDFVCRESASMSGSLEAIIAHLVVRGLRGVTSGNAPAAGNISIQRVTEYIERHFAERVTGAELAKVANLSLSSFSRLFREETGLSPNEYLIEVRIRKAKMMLDDRARSVTDIALACGFYDASHFSSCFLKHSGMTPSRYANLFMAADPADRAPG